MTASGSLIADSRTRSAASNGHGSAARNAVNRNPTTATRTAYWQTWRGPAAVVSRRSMPARISSAPAVATGAAQPRQEAWA